MLDAEVVNKLRVEGLARNKVEKMVDVVLGVEIKAKLRRNAKVVIEHAAAALGRKRIQLGFQTKKTGMGMKVGAVVRERILSKRFATKAVFGGDVERKGTGDVERCRVVAVGSVGRGRRGGY